jgi:hypothetical protein
MLWKVRWLVWYQHNKRWWEDEYFLEIWQEVEEEEAVVLRQDAKGKIWKWYQVRGSVTEEKKSPDDWRESRWHFQFG